jgi:hypothetical protein
MHETCGHASSQTILTEKHTSPLLFNARFADIRLCLDHPGHKSDRSMAQFWLEHSFPPLPSHLEYLGISTNAYQSPTTLLLDGKCDNLVELSLSNFALFSEHPACPRLQRLKLERIDLSIRGYSPIMKWLGSLPLLEFLFLERTGTRIRGELDLDLDSSSKRTTQIAMPHLRVLSIKENVLTTNPLLEALPSPSQSLGVAIIGDINDDNDLIFPLALTLLPLASRRAYLPVFSAFGKRRSVKTLRRHT